MAIKPCMLIILIVQHIETIPFEMYRSYYHTPRNISRLWELTWQHYNQTVTTFGYFMKKLPKEQHYTFSQLTAQPMHLRQSGWYHQLTPWQCADRGDQAKCIAE